MSSLANDQLSRLQQLLATARNEYDALAFVILEGPVQITYHSLKRSVCVPIGGEDVGHINAMLAEATLNRITKLKKEITDAHHQVVIEADDQQTEEQALATYRDQERAGKVSESAGVILATHATTPNQNADST